MVWGRERKDITFNILAGISVTQLHEFFSLWTMLEEVNISDEVADSVTWNLTSSGNRSTSSAYHAQFEGIVTTTMRPVIRNNWTPPKCKFFASLIMQDRVWIVHRLQSKGLKTVPDRRSCRKNREPAPCTIF